VAVEGTDDDVAAFFAFEADSTPLMHHIPAPPEDELPLTQTVIADSGISAKDALRFAVKHVALISGGEKAMLAAAEASGRSGWSPCRVNVPSDELENPFMWALNEGHFKEFPAEEENIRRFGVPDGMSWRRLAWGSTRPECELRRDGSVLHFGSAWSGLLIGYRTLSRMFPSLLFRYLWYSDEAADDAVVGYEILQAGKTLASQDDSIPWADLVPDYEAKQQLASDHRTYAGARAGETLADEMNAAVETLADVWWERVRSVNAS
jgi:hypothetical protein